MSKIMIKTLIKLNLFAMLYCNKIAVAAVEVDPEKTTEYDEKPTWMADALKDIAYYLRAYKFNEFDRRYETDPANAKKEYNKHFPRPPLRSLHWEVHKYCEPSFLECIDYLRKRIRHSTLRRTDDTSIVIHEQQWDLVLNASQIQQIDDECQRLRDIDNVLANPFEGPLERFQWRVTASYYMCWYTMNEVPDLEHIGEPCDNFANCLDVNFGPNNKDRRADDSAAFSCALYSFCPDPCCPNKHLIQLENCWHMQDNPCFANNGVGQRECFVNRSSNIQFRDLILNRWNVSCKCPKGAGYEWSSLYGMCIDVDECAAATTTNSHNCDPKLEACVNLPGGFRCACKWGHAWNSKVLQCTPSSALGLIKLQRHRDNHIGNERKAQSIVKRIWNYFHVSAAFKPISVAYFLAWMIVITIAEMHVVY